MLLRRCLPWSRQRPVYLSPRFIASLRPLCSRTEDKEKSKRREDNVVVPGLTWSPSIPEEEFAEHSPWWWPTWRDWSVSRRIGGFALQRVLRSHTVTVVASAGMLVFGLGFVEGWITCADPWNHVGFVCRFAMENLLPSCVWTTAPAETVAIAMDLDPAQIVRPVHATAEDAAAQLRTHGLFALRSMVASFLMIAQIVHVFSLVGKAGQDFEERVRRGREPPIEGLPERFVRLAGRGSDMTALSLRRYGEHMLPIFEDETLVRWVLTAMRQYAGGTPFPVYWRVRDGEYGMSFPWNGFRLDEEALIRTTTGRRLLVIEADATNSEEALALAQRSQDLTLGEASQAARQIGRALRTSLRRKDGSVLPFRPLRVFLGDTMQPYRTGGGHVMTLRQRVQYTKEMDILVDSRAPVLLALLRWLGRLSGKMRQRERVEEKEKEMEKEKEKETASGEGRAEAEKSPDAWEKKRRRFSQSVGIASEEGITARSMRDLLTDSEAEAQEKDSSWRRFLPWLSSPEKDASGKLPSSSTTGKESSREGRQLWRLCLDTGSEDYFEALSSLMRTFGVDVVDPYVMSPEEGQSLPRLIYHETTAATVNAAIAMVRAGIVDPALCCVIVEKYEGVEELREFMEGRRPSQRAETASDPAATSMASTASEDDKEMERERAIGGVEIICSAVLYDDVLRQVRSWARAGHSFDDIQKELDARFHGILAQQLASQREAWKEKEGLELPSKRQALGGKPVRAGKDSPAAEVLETFSDGTEQFGTPEEEAAATAAAARQEEPRRESGKTKDN